jgi:hypothetical protein
MLVRARLQFNAQKHSPAARYRDLYSLPTPTVVHWRRIKRRQSPGFMIN